MSCPNCDHYFREYGFALKVGQRMMTQSPKACCPSKCVITYYDHQVVKFKTDDEVEHEKNLLDFMKSSWIDYNF